jgi:ABC-type Fe3+-hydroxamate transport system substrate-binding protein
MTATSRVVSLVPSITESLLAWGVVPVAVTRFCEHPELRHVGGTKDPDIDTIVGLRPDVVVMDTEENRLDDAEALKARGVRLHITSVRSVADVEATLAGLAAVLGIHTPPRTPIDLPPLAIGTRRAFVPIWRRPWMTIGRSTYGADLLARLGIAGVFDDSPDPYPEVTLDDAAARRPDLVIAPTEPYPFGARHVAELSQVALDVRIVDGRDLFWWGVRTPAAATRLAAALAAPG